MPKISLNRFFSSIKTSYLPALILGMAVWLSYGSKAFVAEGFYINYGIIYALCFFVICFLFLINRTKPMFEILWLVGAYLAINHLKQPETLNLHYVVSYNLLCLLLPINLIAFYFLPDGAFKQTKNFWILCLMLVQAALIEQVDNFVPMLYDLSMFQVVCGVWVISLLFMVYQISLNGRIQTAGIVFSAFCIFGGLLNYANGHLLTLYFAAAAVNMAIGVIAGYVYSLFRDETTGALSAQSYRWQSRKSFPLKYSLGIICIDNYEKLLSAFGQAKIDKLTVMIVMIIKKLQPNALVFRLDSDEFVLIFCNEDKKQSYEYLESIRRTIAGTTFVLNRDIKLKVTVSAGVSEKKRSDNDADVVLQRTQEAVQRAYKFTQNMTSKV